MDLNSKYIEFGSESRIFALFGLGSRFWSKVGFRSGLGSQGYVINFEEEKKGKNLGKNIFFLCQKIMAPEELFSQSSLWKVNLCLKSSTFCLILSYIFLCGSGSVFGIRIRIHKAPEYGSNTNADPDPQHCPKAKSCTGVRGQPKYLPLKPTQTRQTHNKIRQTHTSSSSERFTHAHIERA